MHLLEAGEAGAPLLILLHGFPELAWSWRHLLGDLARAGFHAVAPDQRGYGHTQGWDASYQADLNAYRPFNLVLDVLSLTKALGQTRVHAVIGHDFGSPVAAWSALLRPDVFRRVVLMSAPFPGPPPLRTDPAHDPEAGLRKLDLALAECNPPRKHYRSYYGTPAANGDLLHAPQGLTRLLRGYYHMKSADWPDNAPAPLNGNGAGAMTALPRYYVMDLDATMAETVLPHTPDDAAAEACRWLPPADLEVYVSEFARTGFQGGLNWYRAVNRGFADQQLFSGRAIEVPALFMAGRSDWGIYQTPGAFETMQARALADLRGVHLIEGAGHWLQQENPAAVMRHLLPFLEADD